MRRLLQAHNFALEGEESRLFMRFYRSNEIAEPQPQPPIEEQSTKGDSSLVNLSATNNQPLPPILSPGEEKLTFMPICNQGEFFVDTKELKQYVALEEVSTAAESPKEVDKLEECKGVGSISLKYYHPWKIIIITVRLFFMISRIFSCERRILEMKALISSSLYHLLSARGRNLLPKVSQIPSAIILGTWKQINEL